MNTVETQHNNYYHYITTAGSYYYYITIVTAASKNNKLIYTYTPNSNGGCYNSPCCTSTGKEHARYQHTSGNGAGNHGTGRLGP